MTTRLDKELDQKVERAMGKGLDYIAGQLRLALFNRKYYEQRAAELEAALEIEKSRTENARKRVAQMEADIRAMCDEIEYGENALVDACRKWVWNDDDTEQRIAQEGYQE